MQICSVIVQKNIRRTSVVDGEVLSTKINWVYNCAQKSVLDKCSFNLTFTDFWTSHQNMGRLQKGSVSKIELINNDRNKKHSPSLIFLIEFPFFYIENWLFGPFLKIRLKVNDIHLNRTDFWANIYSLLNLILKTLPLNRSEAS